ncbi:MAG: hypothetical protein QXL15_00395 [Candidatus Korarchaeota archaeon]
MQKIRVFDPFLFAKNIGISPLQFSDGEIFFAGKIFENYIEIHRNGIVLFEKELDEKVKNSVERMLPVDSTHFIGSDEVGWGNKNEPLIVCAVLMSKQEVVEYTIKGVMDSKLLGKDEIEKFAGELAHLPHSIITVSPRKKKDIAAPSNEFLAELHARAIRSLYLRAPPLTQIIIDQFDRKSIYRHFKHMNLLQESNGERYVPVAAASIIARSELEKWIKKNRIFAT